MAGRDSSHATLASGDDHAATSTVAAWSGISMQCAVALFAFLSAAAHSQEAAKDPDNGTDPTRLSTTALVRMERLDLRGGFSSNTLRISYSAPVDDARRTAVRLLMPGMRNNVLGNDDYGLGDVSVRLIHVSKLTRQYGIVFGGELSANTAKRRELGTGQTVFEGTAIYAKFLQGGHIFAPTIVQASSLRSDRARDKVNTTTLDFYYVPRLNNPRYFVTFDPALNFDWETNRHFASLAVTMGYVIGPAFGGRSQLFAKPTLFAGGERPASWGIEVGYKVIGF